jgi:hypothetical protein
MDTHAGDPLAVAKNLRRVIAGRINCRLRRRWQTQDKAIFRAHCLRSRPWEHSTGPKSETGKLHSRANGWLPKGNKGHNPTPCAPL